MNSTSQYREMRMFVIFDLPTVRKEDIKIYNVFRRNILNDGFIMTQFSVYTRYCRNDTEYRKILRRIKNYVPTKHGQIRVFAITEKQYSKMQLFSSRKKSDEELLSINPFIIIE